MSRADTKRAQLRAGMAADRAVVAIGAHDALTSRLAADYGFDAVWVSGLAVATMTYAIPDVNLTTMNETLEQAVRLDRATDLPVIADCDNGFGGLNNVVRTLVEFEAAGISAISIEDNLFPKRNSLLGADTKRELIPVEEQARRFRAAKAAQESDGFVLIARVESLIAGHGVEDACRRADAYVEAGVDAILIHSRDKTLAEIEGFLSSWQGIGQVPLVAVPTLFPIVHGRRAPAEGLQPHHPRQPADARGGEGRRGDARHPPARASRVRRRPAHRDGRPPVRARRHGRGDRARRRPELTDDPAG